MNQIFIENKINYLDSDYLIELINYTLDKLKIANSSLSLILTDDAEIRFLNNTYRKIDKTTDVLSFALNDGMKLISPVNMLGDIYISIPQMKKQALEYQTGEKRELAFLTIHGLLHLLGYNHENKEDEEVMFKLQKEILNEKKI